MRNILKLSAIAVVVASLSACAVGPDYQTPANVADISFNSPYQQAESLSAGGRHTEAATLYARLADQGDLSAQTRLAWMYEAGRGVPRDLAEAARRFRLAADAGEAEAQYALAVMHRTGVGQDKDLPASLHWLKKAAAQGYPAALAALQSGSAAGLY